MTEIEVARTMWDEIAKSVNKQDVVAYLLSAYFEGLPSLERPQQGRYLREWIKVLTLPTQVERAN